MFLFVEHKVRSDFTLVVQDCQWNVIRHSSQVSLTRENSHNLAMALHVLLVAFSLLLAGVNSVPTYVTIPAAKTSTGAVFTLHNFTAPTGAPGMMIVVSSWPKGRVAVVHRPIGHFHIYYPETSSGHCDGLQLTSQQSGKHGCEFATNGGWCLG